MELHNENPFKIRSYNNAVFNLERLDQALASLDQAAIANLEGVGKSLATVIQETITQQGKPAVLVNLEEKTPEGVMQMLELKGFGPKKIRTLWVELGVETLDQLQAAVGQGQVAQLKGFGKKTQESLAEALAFLKKNSGKLHYATAHEYALEVEQQLQQAFPQMRLERTGAFRRLAETVEVLEWLASPDSTQALFAWLSQQENLEHQKAASSPFAWRGVWLPKQTPVVFRIASPQQFNARLMLLTGSAQHLATPVKEDKTLYALLIGQEVPTETAAYQSFDLPFIEPELREGTFEFERAQNTNAPALLRNEDLKGSLHNHSTYSDGKHSLAEMARACKDLGYEYLGISDHSQTAVYANGLRNADIVRQHEEIDALNKELAPFKIFKGIESDILTDGALDYETEVLQSFDFIVSSIHGGMNMDEQTATQRLITAIENPFTTMLGHPTGRLLLKREGYPIDHKAVIDACAQHEVIIEINANPWRLDLDWRWVHYALEKGVMLSINPDAHDKAHYPFMKYGVLVGRKGGLSAAQTFNALGVQAVAEWFEKRKVRAQNLVSAS